MGFSLPRVTKCCFCASLRSGSLIIGYLSIVSSILSTLAWIALIVLSARFVSDASNNPPPGHTSDDVRSLSTVLFVLYAFELMLSLFYLAISIVLVVGAHMYKPTLMKYYFIAGMVNLVLSLVMIIPNLVFTGFSLTVVQLISCAILFYVLLVVRSAYQEMEENQKPQPKIINLNDMPHRPLMV